MILHEIKSYLPISKCNCTATNLSSLLFLLFTTNQTKTKSDWTIGVSPQIENPNDNTIYYAELFPNIKEGETNPWLSHHEKFDKICNLSAYDPDNHKTIAEHYDCLEMYESLIQKQNDPTSWLVLYRLLNYAVWKRKNASIQNRPSTVTAKAANEGNHRLNGIEYTVMASTYDNSQGFINPGSVTTEWIAANIAGLKGLNTGAVETMMKQNVTNIDNAIEDAMKDKESMLNKQFEYFSYHGKTKAEISKLDQDIKYIHSNIIKNSECLSLHKTNSVIPSENTSIAKGCNNFLDLLERNTETMEECEHATFSANGSCYVEYNPKNPEPLACWESSDGKAFLNHPTLQTMTRFSSSVDCGVVAERKQGKIIGVNKVVHPPQHLNVVSLALGNGNYKYSSKRKAEQYRMKIADGDIEPLHGQTYKERSERGESNIPLGIEDMNRFILVTGIWYPIFRSYHRIEKRNQTSNPLFPKVKEELEFLIETQCYTSSAGDQMGNCAPKGMKDKWKTMMGSQSIFHKNRIYMSAALGITEIILSLLMLPKNARMKKTREFVSFIQTAHNDSTDYDDREFVRIIGMS